jgi:hypothetical protein
MIPGFLSSGLLSVGLHEPASWQEFEDVFGFNAHRRRLMAGLKLACYALVEAGCTTVYVNGSFVTSKELPGDTDVCWDDESVSEDRIDPIFDLSKNAREKRIAQKIRFGGEFFPASAIADEMGRTFLEFFQKGRDDNPKGIVKLNLELLL